MVPVKCSKNKCRKTTIDDLIQCEICEHSWHRECANLTDEQFNLIIDSPQLHWYCFMCGHGCEKLLNIVGKLQSRIDSVEQELRETKDILKKERIQRKIDDDKNEQYSRKDALRINGIPSQEAETNIELEDKVLELAGKIGAKIKREDISVTHRLKPTKKGVHPVIVKFSTRRAKDLVYNSKKNLKGMDGMDDTYISEDLTRLRFRTLLQCKKCPDFKSITTRGGKIKVWKIDNPIPITVESPFDISKLGMEPDLTFLGLQDD